MRLRKVANVGAIVAKVINNFLSTSSTDALSAGKGKELKDMIDGTVLWTNPNSNASFAAQAVTVSDLTPYTRYRVWFRHYANYNYVVCADALVGFGGYGVEIDEAGNRNGRKFDYTSSTVITFDSGKYAQYNLTNYVVDNSRLIPIKIVGYK